MRILRITIENFRGIRSADITFPESRLICIIGAGDSTKSTLLDAIRWNLWTSWNVGATDNDFYNAETSKPIIITGYYTELPDKLMAEDKCGLFLRRAGVPLDGVSDDEPIETENLSVAVRLTVDDTLKPRWEVVTNRDTKEISERDRALMSVGLIGSDCSYDMVWGRHSILRKYADSKDVLKNAYTEAMRKVTQDADLSTLDDVSAKVNDLGRQYGVGFSKEVTNKIIMQAGSFSAVVGLFDGNVPLKQRGLGSQRLLSMALNIAAAEGQPILLIDEIENGLEPYRICNLINEFRINHNDSGQIIMTTHSPVTVSECTVDELLVINNKEGITSAIPLATKKEQVDEDIQKEIRRNPASFLSKKVIVCEGKTEAGFIRALDNWLDQEYKYRIARDGTTVAIGGGDTVFDCAYAFLNCGYEVCILMDSDIEADQNLKTAKKELEAKQKAIDAGITIFEWEFGNSFEEQVFHDINDNLAMKLLNLAIDEKGIESIKGQLENFGDPNEIDIDPITGKELSILLKNLSDDERRRIGSAAKKKENKKGNKGNNGWFKRIDHGEDVGDILFQNWSLIDRNTVLRKVTMSLIKWIRGEKTIGDAK